MIYRIYKLKILLTILGYEKQLGWSVVSPRKFYFRLSYNHFYAHLLHVNH